MEMKLETLTAYRSWESAYNQLTILKNSDNKVVQIISSSIRQPKKSAKEILLNGKKYLLKFK